MIFLASPYSHPDPAVRHRRAAMATACTRHYLAEGYPVFSPIAYGHPLATGTYPALGQPDVPTDAASWRRINTPILSAAHEVWVLMIDGLVESAGVRHELEWASISSPRQPVSMVSLRNLHGELCPRDPLQATLWWTQAGRGVRWEKRPWVDIESLQGPWANIRDIEDDA